VGFTYPVALCLQRFFAAHSDYYCHTVISALHLQSFMFCFTSLTTLSSAWVFDAAALFYKLNSIEHPLQQSPAPTTLPGMHEPC